MSLILDRVNTDEGQTPEKAPAKSKLKLKFTLEHGALAAILGLSAFLGLWNLSINGYSNDFYAAAVRSMTQSWHNFFYLAFDPGAWITVDKPPLAFMIQAAFAKVFGFSGVALLLPEALAGVGGVFLVYYMVRRAFGAATGLLAGLLLAITPIFVVMNRDNNPDSLMVFALILATWAVLRAAEFGKLRWLALSGALVGLAFNIKMLEAWVVLPAFYGMYFLFARTTWLKKIMHLAVVSVVIAVVSFSWAIAVDLTPTADRPYIDGSTDNTVTNLIFGYNGLGRVDGNERGTAGGGFGAGQPGGQQAPTGTDGTNAQNGTRPDGRTVNGYGQPGDQTGTFQPPSDGDTQTQQDGGAFTGGQPAGNFGGGQPGGGGGGMFGGQAGITRLVTPMMAGEFNWYFPLALLGIFFAGGIAFFGTEKGLDRSRKLQSVAVWGGWFLVFGAVLSFSKGIIHTYYMNVMAPAGAALGGIAIVVLWQQYKLGGWKAWFLPVGVAAAAFYQAYLLTDYTSWNWWLSPVLLVVGLTAFAGLSLGLILRKQPFASKFSLGVLAVAVVALLVTPAWWSFRSLTVALTGSTPSAVPTGSGGGFGRGGTSTTSISLPQTWLNFIGSNLAGQLLLISVALVVAAAVAGLWFMFSKQRWFNLPVVSGVLLALFLVGSTGFWLNVAQAKTTTTASAGQGGFGGGPGGNGSTLNVGLLNYLQANQGDYKNILAVSSSNEAAGTIAATGLPVMSLGGFSGSSQTLTTSAQVEALVTNKVVRYFMVGGGMGGGRSNSVVSSYVQQTCQVVDSSQYAGASSTTTSGGGFNRGGFGGGGGTLYKCGS